MTEVENLAGKTLRHSITIMESTYVETQVYIFFDVVYSINCGINSLILPDDQDVYYTIGTTVTIDLAFNSMIKACDNPTGYTIYFMNSISTEYSSSYSISATSKTLTIYNTNATLLNTNNALIIGASLGNIVALSGTSITVYFIDNKSLNPYIESPYLVNLTYDINLNYRSLLARISWSVDDLSCPTLTYTMGDYNMPSKIIDTKVFKYTSSRELLIYTVDTTKVKTYQMFVKGIIKNKA